MRDVELPVEKRGHNDLCLAATSWHDPGYVINLRVVRTMTAVVWMHPRLIDQRHDEATTSYRDPFTVFPTFLPATFARQQAQVSDLAALDAEDLGLDCLRKAALARRHAQRRSPFGSQGAGRGCFFNHSRNCSYKIFSAVELLSRWRR